MPSILPAEPPPEPTETLEGLCETSRGLGALRAEIDRLDDSLHDTLRRRAAVVAEIAALGARAKVPFRPGREAAILRRLLARHDSPLPARAVVRIWRELFAATTAMQGPFAVAVCDPSDQGGIAQLAREHFGALSPLRVHRGPAQAIAEVSRGYATVAVLPLPAEDETARAAWWIALRQQRGEPRIHIVARLPFWAAPRPDGATRDHALVVAAAAPDASGLDRSLIAIDAPVEVSRTGLTGAIAAAGFEPGQVLLRRDGGQSLGFGLADVATHIVQDDPRIGTLARAAGPAVVLGGYAVPVGFEPA